MRTPDELQRPGTVKASGARGPSSFVALLVLAGCTTVGPDFSRPEAPVPAQWQQPTRPALALAPAPAQPLQWWEVFGDPVLDRLIEIARAENYNLKIAGLGVLEARAQLGIGVGSLYPQVQQAVGNATYTTASKSAANTAAGDLSFWEYTVGASVSRELDFWGKYRRAIESADASVLASIAGYDNALVLLTAQVASTYVVIRTAEEQLRVAHDNVALQERSVRITEARFRGGDVDELDVLQGRTQLLNTQATIPQIEGGLEQARNALATLLGRTPGSLGELLGAQPGSIPATPTYIAMGVPAELLRRRPDIREAEFVAATQSAAIGVAEADLYPSFGLSGFLGVVAADGTETTRTGNSGLGQLFRGDSLVFVGGPYFSWNVLNYGRIRNNVRVRDARLQQLLVNYQNTVLNAVREVEDGMVAMLRSREQEQILTASEAAAPRSLKLATLQYREGYTDFQRILDAQRALLSAQQQTVSIPAFHSL